MKVLVTGATGFIGRHLVKHLLNRGDKVKILIRNTRRLGDLERANCQVVVGNLWDSKNLGSVIEGEETVFHLAAIIGKFNVPDKLYWDTNVEGTENLLKACLNKGIKRFLYYSTAGVYGPSQGLPSDENKKPNPSNIYELTKWEGEHIAMDYFRRFDLPITIVRPEFVYGPGNTHILGLFQAIRRRYFFIIGSGENYLHPTYIDDAISGLIKASQQKNSIGEIFNIAGERPISVNDLARKIAQNLGVEINTIHIPLYFANPTASLFEMIAKLTGINPPLTKSRVKFLTENRISNIDKARKSLGYIPRTSIEEGLKKSIDWYKSEGYI